MVGAHAHPGLVGGEVVDPVRAHATVRLVIDDEVVHQHPLRVARGAQLPAAVLEGAHELLLLGVHADDRLPQRELQLDRVVDVAELGVPVGVARALERLAVGLEAVAHRRGAARATIWWLTAWPRRRSSAARFRTLLVVQRSGDSGSPRVVGSMSASRSARSVGSRCSMGGRPHPPAGRVRARAAPPHGHRRRPRRTVVAREAPSPGPRRPAPPRPMASASDPAISRRARSSSSGDSARYRVRDGRLIDHPGA